MKKKGEELRDEGKAVSDVMPPSRARELFLDANYQYFDLNEKKKILKSVATHLKSMYFGNEETDLWFERMLELIFIQIVPQ